MESTRQLVEHHKVLPIIQQYVIILNCLER